jgi:hypothetical protein
MKMFLAMCAIAGVVAIPCCWYHFVRPHQIHARAYARISDSVESLASRRPADVSREQWSFIIGWSMNGIGNCCSVEGFLNPDKASHERFLTLPDRFERRLHGDVSLETVDWLWNELEIISKYGTRYSDQWRPTTAERLEKADSIPVGNSGPIVN